MSNSLELYPFCEFNRGSGLSDFGMAVGLSFALWHGEHSFY